MNDEQIRSAIANAEVTDITDNYDDDRGKWFRVDASAEIGRAWEGSAKSEADARKKAIEVLTGFPEMDKETFAPVEAEPVITEQENEA